MIDISQDLSKKESSLDEHSSVCNNELETQNDFETRNKLGKGSDSDDCEEVNRNSKKLKRQSIGAVISIKKLKADELPVDDEEPLIEKPSTRRGQYQDEESPFGSTKMLSLSVEKTKHRKQTPNKGSLSRDSPSRKRNRNFAGTSSQMSNESNEQESDTQLDSMEEQIQMVSKSVMKLFDMRAFLKICVLVVTVYDISVIKI